MLLLSPIRHSLKFQFVGRVVLFWDAANIALLLKEVNTQSIIAHTYEAYEWDFYFWNLTVISYI